MNRNLKIAALASLIGLAPLAAQADTTSIFTAPSTATQAASHGRADAIYVGNTAGTFDFGLEYGATSHLEVGVSSHSDNTAQGLNSPQGIFNAKYRFFDEKKWTPALAVGFQGLAYNELPSPMQTRWYAAVSKHVGPLSLTVGEYTFRKDFAAYTGAIQRTNAYAGVSLPILRDLSLAADSTVGRNTFGRTSYGLDLRLPHGIEFQPGYVTYNDKAYGQNAAVGQIRIQLP